MQKTDVIWHPLRLCGKHIEACAKNIGKLRCVNEVVLLLQALGPSIPVDATDDQIKTQLKGQPAPDAKCCATAGNFITGASY